MFGSFQLDFIRIEFHPSKSVLNRVSKSELLVSFPVPTAIQVSNVSTDIALVSTETDEVEKYFVFNLKLLFWNNNGHK